MVEFRQRVLVTVKDAICFMKNLGEILASQTLHPSIEKPMINGQAELPARPQSKLRCGGGERATLGSGGARKYGCDQTGCGGLSVVEQLASLIGALNRPIGDRACGAPFAHRRSATLRWHDGC